MKTKRVGDLKRGDTIVCISPDDGRRTRGTITFAGPSKETVYPYRKDAERKKVPAWSVFWRYDHGDGPAETGRLVDPDDRVEII